MKKKALLFLTILNITIFSSCREPSLSTTSGPPRPKLVCVSFSINTYCSSFGVLHNTGNNNLVLFSEGAISLEVTGTNTTPVFEAKTLFTPLHHNGIFGSLNHRPGLHTSTNSSSHLISASGMDFEVPSQHDYSVKITYIQYDRNYPSQSTTGNSTNCIINDPAFQCNRFIKMYSFGAGTGKEPFLGNDCREFIVNIPSDPAILGKCN